MTENTKIFYVDINNKVGEKIQLAYQPEYLPHEGDYLKLVGVPELHNDTYEVRKVLHIAYPALGLTHVIIYLKLHKTETKQK